MIRSLNIKNFAIIDEVSLAFEGGLTIITGETGAGKSILLGALNLILGGRVDSKMFFNQDDKCVIEAEFDISDYDLYGFFEEEDLDFDQHVIIRREILPSGKSRAFINDTPVNLKALQHLSSQLIDIHEQFDTLSIQTENFQRNALDALARHKDKIKSYETEFKEYAQAVKSLEELRSTSDKQEAEQEYRQFLFDELEALHLTEGIQNMMESELAILENAELIKKNLNAAYQHLSESDNSIFQQLREVNLLLQAVSKFNDGIGGLSERLEQVQYEIEDIAVSLEQIADKTEFDPEKTNIFQTKLDEIYRLLKKHKLQNSDQLMAMRNQLELQLNGEGDVGEMLAKLEKKIVELLAHLKSTGAEISKGRKSAALVLESKVNEMLQQLNMPNALLKVHLYESEQPGPHGLEQISYLFSANKGSVPAEIRTVASGGELSRLALSIQSLVASSIPLPTMVFDEIDSGVSGAVSLKVGNILRTLSDKHQVIVITHSPQIAAKANKHYHVYKTDIGTQTKTYVRELSVDERIASIAIMLSTDPPTKAALENARELMEIS